MRFIIGLIIFWLSILGIKKIIEDKAKVDKMFSLPLAFSAIGIIIFIAGILNMLKLFSILLVLAGTIYLIIDFVKNKNNIKDIKKQLKNPSIIITILIFLYITIVGIGMHLTHYDNFSHWGLIIKNMFLDNAFPNFEDKIIMFKGYQPGSACFIYFFGLLCGKTEGSMIVAQNYLIFANLTPLLGFIKKDNKWLKRLIFIIFYVFIMTISIKFSDLLVDSLLATLTITSLAIIYNYKDNLKKGFIYSLPISIFLLLVKNTGLILAGINCLYILYIAYKNKNLKEGIKYVVITGITLLMFLLIWQSHVSLVYGNTALNSKHSLSTENIILQLRTKGWTNIFTFIKDYIFHLFSIKNNKSNIFMIVINIILSTLLVEKDKKERKNILALIGTVNLIYLGYYAILGVMYLLSMPWEEAIIFAGYDRYMSTIIIIIIGIIFMYLFKYKEKKHQFKLISIIILISMLTPTYFYKENAMALFGEDHYENSIVKKFDEIIEDIETDKDKSYYIYSPSSKEDFGYLEFLSKYKLNSSNIEIIYNLDEIKEDKTIIIIDENTEITEYLNKNNWKEKRKLVYTK